MPVVELKEDYRVRADREIQLSIMIGDAQIGVSAVFLEDRKVGQGDIHDFVIGPGAEIKGKRLKIKTIVTDVNDNTNQTSVTYLFKGGDRDHSFSASAMVDQEHGSVTYRAVITFI